MDNTSALERLVDGNRRHAQGSHLHPHCDAHRRTGLASGQRPWAAILGCSDSRVPPEIVFDQGLGDLFVVRTAGHVVDDVALASLGYAIERLGVPLLVVLGHTGCGAVHAALGWRPEDGDNCLCAAIRPAIEQARLCGGDLCDQATRAHIQRVADYLRCAFLSDHIAVVGAVYDLASGRVEFLQLPVQAAS